MQAFQHRVDESHPLIPGYTGYIPFKFYRIGKSYGNDSVWCMDAFRKSIGRKNHQKDELKIIAATAPRLPPICSNEETIEVLDAYNYKHHPYVLGPVETKRSLLEPPIPGWTGFVPRSKVTEFGHGVRYHVMAGNCYQDFKEMFLDRVQPDPASKESTGGPHVPKLRRTSHQHQRCYWPDGMMPKYMGHIPHERSVIGKTFGNVCRSCSVCGHDDKSYGAYLAKKHKAEREQEQLKEGK